MKRMTFTSKNNAKKVQQIIDKAFSLPKAGVPIGGGYYDPVQVGAETWTTVQRVTIKTKDSNGNVISKNPQNTWVLINDNDISDILTNNELNKNLTNAEKNSLQNAIASQIIVSDDQDDLEEDN